MERMGARNEGCGQMAPRERRLGTDQQHSWEPTKDLQSGGLGRLKQSGVSGQEMNGNNGQSRATAVKEKNSNDGHSGETGIEEQRQSVVCFF